MAIGVTRGRVISATSLQSPADVGLARHLSARKGPDPLPSTLFIYIYIKCGYEIREPNSSKTWWVTPDMPLDPFGNSEP